MSSRTCSAQSAEVWLEEGNEGPAVGDPRALLLAGLELIATIRAEIGQTAKVASMPPIEIVPYIWRGEKGGFIHGRMSLLTIGGVGYFGVRLPAQAAACPDYGAVRGLLVHEFSHCFFYATEVVNASDFGVSPEAGHTDLRPLEARPDSELHINPSEWFGAEDAAGFIYTDDPKTLSIDLMAAVLASVFRSVVADPGGGSMGVRISDDVRQHIRRLRTERLRSGHEAHH